MIFRIFHPPSNGNADNLEKTPWAGRIGPKTCIILDTIGFGRNEKPFVYQRKGWEYHLLAWFGDFKNLRGELIFCRLVEVNGLATLSRKLPCFVLESEELFYVAKRFVDEVNEATERIVAAPKRWPLLDKET